MDMHKLTAEVNAAFKPVVLEPIDPGDFLARWRGCFIQDGKSPFHSCAGGLTWPLTA